MALPGALRVAARWKSRCSGMASPPRASALLALLDEIPGPPRCPVRTATSRAAQAPAPAPAADIGEASQPLPAFESWKVAELKSECKRLGLVTSRPKHKLAELLYQAYAYRDQDTVRCPPNASKVPEPICISDSDSSPAAPSAGDSSDSDLQYLGAIPAARRSHGRSSSEPALEEQIASLSLDKRTHQRRTSPTRARPRRRRDAAGPPSEASSDAEVHSDIEAEEAPRTDASAAEIFDKHANTLDVPMNEAIMSNVQLYRRILLFEPVSLDEFMSLAARAGCTTGSSARDRSRISTWLDTQGICFYEGEL